MDLIFLGTCWKIKSGAKKAEKWQDTVPVYDIVHLQIMNREGKKMKHTAYAGRDDGHAAAVGRIGGARSAHGLMGDNPDLLPNWKAATGRCYVWAVNNRH